MDVLLDRIFREFSADQALDRVESVLGIGDSLTLGRRADQRFAVFKVGNDRGGRTGAFRIFEDLDLTTFHDCHAAVGRAEVDTDNLAHGGFTFKQNSEIGYGNLDGA